jgi:predicted enzyme related to lactoylglutathione lyase
MARPVVHFEFWSQDPAKVSTFYEKTFGWKFQEVPGMDYRVVDTGAGTGINGGIMKPRQGPWLGNLSFYIDVDDVAAYVKKICDVGGKILVENQEVPGVGTFALFSDPDGRVLGVWKKNLT